MNKIISFILVCFIAACNSARADLEPYRAEFYRVDALIRAGAILEFRPLEQDGILPYEPLTGHLVLRNAGTTALKYYRSILGNEHIKMIIIQPDGSGAEKPIRHPWEPVSKKGRRGAPAILEPNEEHGRLLIFGTAGTPLTVPGTHRAVFAINRFGTIQTGAFDVTVIKPGRADKIVLREMRKLTRLNPREKNPVLPSARFMRRLLRKKVSATKKFKKILRIWPGSRYSAGLSLMAAKYTTVEKEREEFLRIAAEHGSQLQRNQARVKLASLMTDQGRYAKARREFAAISNVASRSVWGKMRSLARKLGEVELPASHNLPQAQRILRKHKKRWRKRPRIRFRRELTAAEREHILNGSPEAIARTIKLEGKQIVDVIREYYESVTAGDAERFSAITGLDVRKSRKLIEKRRMEKAMNGAVALTEIKLPSLHPKNLDLDIDHDHVGEYIAIIQDMKVTTENKQGRRTLHVMDNVFLHLKRDAEGRWSVNERSY
ncbi:MAG: hypothetical protein GY862_23780 [Gammaproteobacteria bacterium]|nr:hypothetical protein [Gammaproteobacteria bacterium]